MSVVLNLPVELANELAAEAARLNLPLDEYAVRVLTTAYASGKPRTGAELVAYWQNAGIVGTKAGIPDAAVHARELREKAERRERT